MHTHTHFDAGGKPGQKAFKGPVLSREAKRKARKAARKASRKAAAADKTKNSSRATRATRATTIFG
tara:strand:+ start:617 stop:814 length:198 start_codon:yes stop_codon:yes gene_type:complete